MTLQQFDSIDESYVYFREQAYAFSEMERHLYGLKIAVMNPIDLLPFKEYHTVPTFLKNIDRICQIGS